MAINTINLDRLIFIWFGHFANLHSGCNGQDRILGGFRACCFHSQGINSLYYSWRACWWDQFSNLIFTSLFLTSLSPDNTLPIFSCSDCNKATEFPSWKSTWDGDAQDANAWKKGDFRLYSTWIQSRRYKVCSRTHGGPDSIRVNSNGDTGDFWTLIIHQLPTYQPPFIRTQD